MQQGTGAAVKEVGVSRRAALRRWAYRVNGLRAQARGMVLSSVFTCAEDVFAAAERMVAEVNSIAEIAEVQRRVLHGIVWATVTERFEVPRHRRVEMRLADWQVKVIARASSRAQFGLVNMARLPLAYREVVQCMVNEIGRINFGSYFIGAASVGRVVVTMQQVRHWELVLATEDQDVFHGIDAWVCNRQTERLIPVQIKGTGHEDMSTACITRVWKAPDCFDKSDPRRRTWYYLDSLNMPLRILDVRVGAMEGRSAIAFEHSPSLKVALERELGKFYFTKKPTR